MITRRSIVQARPGVHVEDLGGEVVLMDSAGAVYGVDQVGAAVWAEIGTPAVVGRVIRNMADAFGVPRETAEPGVLAFLEQVQRFGLLDVTF